MAAQPAEGEVDGRRRPRRHGGWGEWEEVGESLGASSAIIATGEEPAIAATWADSGFADPGVLFDEVIAREGLPTWLRPGVIGWGWMLADDDLLAHRPIDSITKIGARPLAIVHGFAAPAEYKRRIVEYFRSGLGPSGS